MSTETDKKFIETGIGPITDKILNSVLIKFLSPEISNKIDTLFVKPLSNTLFEKCYPLFLITLISYLILIILIIFIIYKIK